MGESASVLAYSLCPSCRSRFPALFPAFSGYVECPLARPVVATCVYAAISRCNRVASVRAIDGVVVDMYVNGWRLKGVSYSGGS